MKTLLTLLFVAGLGLAQDKPKADAPDILVSAGGSVIRTVTPLAGKGNLLIAYPSPPEDKIQVAGSKRPALIDNMPKSEGPEPIYWRNAPTEVARVKPSGDIYIGGVTDTPFAMLAEGLPHVFTIVNRDGKPLVRCVAATQKCTLITETK